MCDVVDRVIDGNQVLTLDGRSTRIRSEIFVPFNEGLADNGITYPVGCRHKKLIGWTDWEQLPKPGAGQAVRVPPESELTLGIVVDGKFLQNFTDEEHERFLAG